MCTGEVFCHAVDEDRQKNSDGNSKWSAPPAARNGVFCCKNVQVKVTSTKEQGSGDRCGGHKAGKDSAHCGFSVAFFTAFDGVGTNDG